jgi:hypothetical protein
MACNGEVTVEDEPARLHHFAHFVVNFHHRLAHSTASTSNGG